MNKKNAFVLSLATLAVFAGSSAFAVPKYILRATETSGMVQDQSKVVSNECIVDEFGIATVYKIEGLDEKGAPIKLERNASVLSMDELNMIKTQITGAANGEYEEDTFPCDGGSVEVQAYNLETDEFFDIFAARDCNELRVNTSEDAKKLLAMMKTTCGLKLDAPGSQPTPSPTASPNPTASPSPTATPAPGNGTDSIRALIKRWFK